MVASVPSEKMMTKKTIQDTTTKIKTRYSIGDVFVMGADLYMLAQIANFTVALIELRGGNYWDAGKQVEDPYSISVREMEYIVGLHDLPKLIPVKELAISYNV